MTLSVAFQMDPMDQIHPETDSSLALALEAQRRGHQNWYYMPKDLAFDLAFVKATARSLTVKDSAERHCVLGKPEMINLADMDVVWIRQNPPFDMAYYTNTCLLELQLNSTKVINNPAAIRNCPEKLLPLRFPQLIPPTMITDNYQDLEVFWYTHKAIILKPLYDFGGNNVFLIREDSQNFNSVISILQQTYRLPFITQRFIPDVLTKGDKRIIIVDGKPVGAFARMPKAHEFRSNMLVGGTPVASTLSKRDLEICETIGPTLKEQGLLFVGIDVIGDYLTEINVTSPTGINALNKLDDTCIEAKLWDAIEEKI